MKLKIESTKWLKCFVSRRLNWIWVSILFKSLFSEKTKRKFCIFPLLTPCLKYTGFSKQGTALMLNTQTEHLPKANVWNMESRGRGLVRVKRTSYRDENCTFGSDWNAVSKKRFASCHYCLLNLFTLRQSLSTISNLKIDDVTSVVVGKDIFVFFMEWNFPILWHFKRRMVDLKIQNCWKTIRLRDRIT